MLSELRCQLSPHLHGLFHWRLLRCIQKPADDFRLYSQVRARKLIKHISTLVFSEIIVSMVQSEHFETQAARLSVDT